jgi:hypothetical protein
MLLSELKTPFHREGWVYEEKYDRYRILAVKNAGQVTLWEAQPKGPHGKHQLRASSRSAWC